MILNLHYSQTTLLNILAIGIALIAAFAQIMGFGFVPYVLVIGMCAGAILLQKPKTMLFLFWLLLSLYPYAATFFSFRAMAYVDEMMLAALLVSVLGTVIIKKEIFPKIQSVTKIFWALVVLALVSKLVNRSLAYGLANYCLSYFGFYIVFFMAYRYSRQINKYHVLMFLTIYLIIQICFNIGWFVGINPFPNHRMGEGSVDFAIGTMENSLIVAYYSIILLFIYVGIWCESKNTKITIAAAMMGLLAFINFYLTSTKHAYAYLFGGVAATVLFSSLAKAKKVLYSCMFVFMASIAFIALEQAGILQRFQEVSHDKGMEDLSSEYIRYRWETMLQGAKGTVYKNVFYYAAKEMPFYYYFIGAGPANFASSIGFFHRSYWADKYVNIFYLTFTGRMSRFGGSITQNIHTGLMSIFSELGMIGVLLYYGVHIYAGLHLVNNFRKNKYTDIYTKAFAMAALMTIGIILSLSFLMDSFMQKTIMLGMWILIGLVWDGDEPRIEEPAESRPALTRNG